MEINVVQCIAIYLTSDCLHIVSTCLTKVMTAIKTYYEEKAPQQL